MSSKRNRIQLLLERPPIQWTILLVVFFGTAGAIFVLNDNFYNEFRLYSDITPIKSIEHPRVVRVTIDFGNGKKRAFEGEVVTAMSAAEALREAQKIGSFSLKIMLNGDIAELGGFISGPTKRWRWYLNNSAESRPILDVTIGGGDKILLKYE